MSPPTRERLAFESECLSRMFWKRFLTCRGQNRSLINAKSALALPVKLIKNEDA